MPKHETTTSVDAEELGLPAGETVTVTLSRSTVDTPEEPDPGDDETELPPDSDLSVTWGKGILALPPYPEAEVDLRDVTTVVRNEKAYQVRLRDYLTPGTPDQPGSGPVVTKTLGTRGTVNIFDEGARGQNWKVDKTAFTQALLKVRDGGKVFIPYGKWLGVEINVPGHKDLIIEGETELGAEVEGLPGKDIFVWDDDNTQRRLQNRPIIRNLRFFMPGDGQRGSFNRKTKLGWRPGAACLAWIQKQPTSDGNRKQAWGNSYVTVQNCTARGDKDAVGATFLYSDRALYGLRVQNLFIGDHGTDVSGLHGGIVMGVPPFPVAEYAPDEVSIDHFVHWGGQTSIAIANIANGQIRDHKAYTCRWPLHLTGQDNTGPRERSRELELNGLYYDNDVVVTTPGDPEMLHLDVDNCVFGTIHFKGSRDGQARPTLHLSGRNIRGGIIALYSSTRHQAPKFRINGDGHRFAVDPAGLDSQDKATLFNGRSSYPGVEVL